MAVPATDLTRLNRNLIRKEGKMLDSAMIERLRDQVSSIVLKDLLSYCPPEWRLGLAKFYSASPEAKVRLQMRLRQGERVTFKLPHSTGLLDRVKIGGAFFSASEDPIRDAVNILADMIAVPRPVCWSGIFELDIQSPEHVEWRVCLHDGESEIEIQKGTDPLDQALAKMAGLGHQALRLENIEESQLNMLSLVGTLEKKLRGWKVSLLRSCCLILMKRRWLDPFFHSIHLCLMPGRAVVACTAIHSGNSDHRGVLERGDLSGTRPALHLGGRQEDQTVGGASVRGSVRTSGDAVGTGAGGDRSSRSRAGGVPAKKIGTACWRSDAPRFWTVPGF
jgi:hypothetical protein